MGARAVLPLVGTVPSLAQGDSALSERNRGVLVVDDDRDLLAVLRQQLSPLEVEIYTAGDGLEALRALDEPGAPNVLVVDYDMPHLTGGELCQRLRASARLANTYVIMLSGWHGTDAVNSLDRGADDYLAKPYDVEVLRASVRAGLRVQAQRRLLARRERRRAMAWLATVAAHEINNPLAVALSAHDRVAELLRQERLSAEEQAELRELFADSRAVLERISRTTSRWNARQALFGAGPEDVLLPALMEQIRLRMAALGFPARVCVEKRSQASAHFDAELLLQALERVVEAAAPHCDGTVEVKVHMNDCRVAFLMELSGAPPSLDPEIIFEPRLSSEGDSPAHFDAGLSGIEAAFESFGGQMYVRPVGSKWRFGLTLPVSAQQPEPVLTCVG